MRRIRVLGDALELAIYEVRRTRADTPSMRAWVSEAESLRSLFSAALDPNFLLPESREKLDFRPDLDGVDDLTAQYLLPHKRAVSASFTCGWCQERVATRDMEPHIKKCRKNNSPEEVARKLKIMLEDFDG